MEVARGDLPLRLSVSIRSLCIVARLSGNRETSNADSESSLIYQSHGAHRAALWWYILVLALWCADNLMLNKGVVVVVANAVLVVDIHVAVFVF